MDGNQSGEWSRVLYHCDDILIRDTDPITTTNNLHHRQIDLLALQYLLPPSTNTTTVDHNTR